MILVRYVLPAVLLVAGLLCLLFVNGSARLDAWAGFTGTALAVFLLNLLFRIGAQGDAERAREEAARQYFDQHGEWPQEEKKPAGRRWTLPAGVAMPEQEEREHSR